MINVEDSRLRLGDWLALAFWPLWALVLVLQLLDLGSVGLAFAQGSPVHEINPVVLRLAAHYGVLAAMLVKFVADVTLLGLALALWALGDGYRWRWASIGATLWLLAAGILSAWVFWANLATVLGTH